MPTSLRISKFPSSAGFTGMSITITARESLLTRDSFAGDDCAGARPPTVVGEVGCRFCRAERVLCMRATMIGGQSDGGGFNGLVGNVSPFD